MHAGDSRVYHFRGAEMMQRTIDHSFVQRLIDEGKITEEEANTHPQSNLLTGCLGTHADPPLTLWHIDRLEFGDTVLACSDGLWHYFTPKEMGAIVHTLPPREASEMLISKARQRARGGGDNLSLALVRIDRRAERTGLGRTLRCATPAVRDRLPRRPLAGSGSGAAGLPCGLAFGQAPFARARARPQPLPRAGVAPPARARRPAAARRAWALRTVCGPRRRVAAAAADARRGGGSRGGSSGADAWCAAAPRCSRCLRFDGRTPLGGAPLALGVVEFAVRALAAVPAPSRRRRLHVVDAVGDGEALLARASSSCGEARRSAPARSAAMRARSSSPASSASVQAGTARRAASRRIGAASGERGVDLAPLQRQELGRLHLVQARHGARKLVRQRPLGVQPLRRHLGRQ